jgi:hypothetical protein
MKREIDPKIQNQFCYFSSEFQTKLRKVYLEKIRLAI